jgi:hypothetical protein
MNRSADSHLRVNTSDELADSAVRAPIRFMVRTHGLETVEAVYAPPVRARHSVCAV